MEESFMSLEDAQRILRSRMQALTDALGQCQKVWNKEYAFAQMTLNTSARATILNQHWYAAARAIFASDSGVLFGKDQQQQYAVIDGQIIMRFKFLDNNLSAHNYPTDHALDWSYQMPLGAWVTSRCSTRLEEIAVK